MSAASQKNNEERQKKYNKKIDFPELTIFSASLGKKGGEMELGEPAAAP